MGWAEDHLPDQLDARGDLAPPWARFPEYERYSIGWRMGAGEAWLSFYHAFLATVPATYQARLAYLRRHPPAPYSWWRTVWHTLHPDAVEEDDEDGDDEAAEEARAQALRASLLEAGLIASDIASHTWLNARADDPIAWPWAQGDSPEEVARYNTRELWFWSRQVAALRAQGSLKLDALPASWQALRPALASGQRDGADLSRGLWTLTLMMCAGEVVAPWRLGLTPEDFEESFELEMRYTDAFNLWVMSAFDDQPHWQAYLASQGPIDEAWSAWLAGPCWQVCA